MLGWSINLQWHSQVERAGLRAQGPTLISEPPSLIPFRAMRGGLAVFQREVIMFLPKDIFPMTDLLIRSEAGPRPRKVTVSGVWLCL